MTCAPEQPLVDSVVDDQTDVGHDVSVAGGEPVAVDRGGTWN
ncbi:MAG TPA: hypothetical protein VFU13_11220 [Steroidobacteraceae bacterium]|nr:hypothetical protein [Steroidobacteraceae bacterium]